jgi:hypothetical protein
MGLQLGTEGLLHSNVGLWGQIKNKVSNIVIYACAAADTEPGNENTTADGKYLMGALALTTNADVYASDRIQWYLTYKGLHNGAHNFGTWEGTLYKFPAQTGMGTAVASVPVELTAVLNGTAPGVAARPRTWPGLGRARDAAGGAGDGMSRQERARG